MTDIKQANNLITENDSYLLLHAYNPVDWNPWNDETLDLAREEHKPLFLCIGYSTCHQCHVLARDCFQNEAVADAINNNFVPVMVDRDQQPDIALVYTEVCLAANRYSGYPLIVIMTPYQEPIFAGCYQPDQAWSTPSGMIKLMTDIGRQWKQHPNDVIQSAMDLADQARQNWLSSQNLPDEATFLQAKREILESWDNDETWINKLPGPNPSSLLFLLNYHRSNEDTQSLAAVEKVLSAAYGSGCFDHLAGGFFSPCPGQTRPQLEKTLTGNALWASVYLEARRLTGQNFYAMVAREILEYVLLNLASPNGAFFSAQGPGPESDGFSYFTWTEDEIRTALGKDSERFFAAYWLSQYGSTDRNLIARQKTPEERIHCAEDQAHLLTVRNRRKGMFVNDMVVTAANGLMITALAQGAVILGDRIFWESAKLAADFILHNHRRPDGRLLTASRGGGVRNLGVASDYAYFISGLIALYEAGAEEIYLTHAANLSKDMVSIFWDEENDGLFFYGKDGEELLRRPKEFQDRVIPSSNAVAAMNLAKLARLTEESKFEDWSRRLLGAFAGNISGDPINHSYWLTARIFDMEEPLPPKAKEPPREDKEPDGTERDQGLKIEVIPIEEIELPDLHAYTDLAGNIVNDRRVK